MFIVTTDAVPAGAYIPRTIYDATDATAAALLAAGHAFEMKEEPEYVRELFARLDDAADRPVIFKPFTGEFGHEVMSHMRLVHWHRAAEKIVCCPPGHEVLYPSATSFVTDWTNPVPDAGRVSTIAHDVPEWPAIAARFADHVVVEGANGLSPEQQIFAVHPDQCIELSPKRRGLTADIVFGVRHREFCPERNWDHWQTLAQAAREAGLSFAVIGDRATSFDLDGQIVHSGDFDTDAAVELLQNCRLYVGTDSGGSHLAATVGARMLVFRETLSGSRDLTARMAVVNSGRVETVPGGWERPKHVAARMITITALDGTHRDHPDLSDVARVYDRAIQEHEVIHRLDTRIGKNAPHPTPHPHEREREPAA